MPQQGASENAATAGFPIQQRASPDTEWTCNRQASAPAYISNIGTSVRSPDRGRCDPEILRRRNIEVLSHQAADWPTGINEQEGSPARDPAASQAGERTARSFQCHDSMRVEGCVGAL